VGSNYIHLDKDPKPCAQEVTIRVRSVHSASNRELIDDGRFWVTPDGDDANHRYSGLRQINAHNVDRLVLAWTYQTEVPGDLGGSPLVIGDRMYVHSPNDDSVTAVSLMDHSRQWTYRAEASDAVKGAPPPATSGRGFAYGDGMIMVQQADSRLVAINSRTGKVAWKERTADPAAGEFDTSVPQVFDDKVLVEVAGTSTGTAGRVIAYAIRTGHTVWSASNSGPDGKTLVDASYTFIWVDGKRMPAGSSSFPTWETSASGPQDHPSIMHAARGFSFDPALNLVYYASADSVGLDAGHTQPATTIWARDLDTGVPRWFSKMAAPAEGQNRGADSLVLVNIEQTGKSAPALARFEGNGYGYTVNRETGELLSAKPYDPILDWASKIDVKTGRPVSPSGTTGPDVDAGTICPPQLGTRDEQPLSYDRAAGIIFVPATKRCVDYDPFNVTYTSGESYTGVTLTVAAMPDTHDGLGSFVAWDPTRGKAVWSKPERFSIGAGALSTAGKILFYGTLDGYLKAVSTADGRELWKYKMPSGVIGKVFSYEYLGREYIGAYSGVIGGWANAAGNARVTEGHPGLGAISPYKDIAKYTNLGGGVFLFALPD